MKVVKLPFETEQGQQKDMNITLRPASRNVRKQLNECSEFYQKKSDEIDEQYPEIQELRTFPKDEQKKRLAADAELNSRNEELKKAMADLQEEYQIEAFKIVVDRNFLNDTDRKAIMSEWNSDFYSSVDLNVLLELVQSFR